MGIRIGVAAVSIAYEASKEGFKLKTTIVGVVILAMSMMFLYLYLFFCVSDKERRSVIGKRRSKNAGA